MRKYVIIFMLILSAACTEEGFKTYSGGNYLSFLTNIKEDSTIMSFYFYPTETELYVNLPVALAGEPLKLDEKFTVSVVGDLTTALPANYKLEPEYTFRANQAIDTIRVKVIKTPDDVLKTKEFRLVIQIDPNEVFTPGQTQLRMAKIIFSDLAARPEWWTSEVSEAYLGEYSEVKYQEFIKVTLGEATLFGEKDPSEKRELALYFKYYLQKMEDAGTPVMDGSKSMKVTVIG